MFTPKTEITREDWAGLIALGVIGVAGVMLFMGQTWTMPGVVLVFLLFASGAASFEALRPGRERSLGERVRTMAEAMMMLGMAFFAAWPTLQLYMLSNPGEIFRGDGAMMIPYRSSQVCVDAIFWPVSWVMIFLAAIPFSVSGILWLVYRRVAPREKG